VVDGGKVGFAGFFGRSAHADENNVGGADGFSGIGSVGDAACFASGGEDGVEVALVDGDVPGIQAGDAVGVDVGADYFVARFREARGGDQAHIPTANHRKMQANSPEPE